MKRKQKLKCLASISKSKMTLLFDIKQVINIYVTTKKVWVIPVPLTQKD